MKTTFHGSEEEFKLPVIKCVPCKHCDVVSNVVVQRFPPTTVILSIVFTSLWCFVMSSKSFEVIRVSLLQLMSCSDARTFNEKWVN